MEQGGSSHLDGSGLVGVAAPSQGEHLPGEKVARARRLALQRGIHQIRKQIGDNGN